MRRLVATGVACVAILAANTATATPIQLITNGNFETGTFAGWTHLNQAGGSGDWFIDTPGTTTPLSGQSTLSTAANGSSYAVTDQGGPGSHVLLQSFTVAPGSTVSLVFDMFANDYDAGPIVNAAGLTYTAVPNQHARVDILSAAAGAFDTGAGVLANYYLGVDAGADPHPFTHYVFNITSVVGGGGTFQLRFAEVDNQFFFNLGVDNVSVQAEAVPEPTTLLLVGAGLGAAAIRRRRQRRDP